MKWLRLRKLWLFSFGCLLGFAMREPVVADIQPDCAIHQGGCRGMIQNREVVFDIEPKPVTAMQELKFKVSITGPPLGQPPYIELGMPGMKMGPNRVAMEKVDSATYAGKGVIVRCPSGRRIWRATVTVPDVGRKVFTFDVVY